MFSVKDGGEKKSERCGKKVEGKRVETKREMMEESCGKNKTYISES